MAPTSEKVEQARRKAMIAERKRIGPVTQIRPGTKVGRPFQLGSDDCTYPNKKAKN